MRSFRAFYQFAFRAEVCTSALSQYGREPRSLQGMVCCRFCLVGYVACIKDEINNFYDGKIHYSSLRLTSDMYETYIMIELLPLMHFPVMGTLHDMPDRRGLLTDVELPNFLASQSRYSLR